ncbi:MAG: OmpA family protein [Flavobacteriales bacterium]|nr:OmpA family protein [Flavobacteriales bacterium]
MKKITLLMLLLASSSYVFSQETEKKEDEAVDSQTFNRWTLEATVGQGKGLRPYQKGYFSSDSGSLFGGVDANSYSLAARYMFTPVFGIRGRFGYDDLKNQPDTGSEEFRLQMLSFRPEGVINLNRLFGAEDVLGRLGFLFHAGLDISQVTSKTPNVIENDHNYGVNEYNGGIVVGLTPQFRIANKLSILFDVSMLKNFRQHFNWDGSYSDTDNNLGGEYISASLGLSYSFGKDKIHGDWAVIKDPKIEEIEALDKRVGDMEELMNDTDKDGVPDYLDQENNSLAGVAVDTRGRMVDLNKNGVPDELETYFKNNGILPTNSSTTTNNNTSSDEARNLINGGYVSAYFDTNKTRPTNVSSQGIDFILNYLRKNPDSKLEIYGHADEIGTNAYNDKLANDRAESIKNVLIKAGIDGGRISIKSDGEDNSVDPKSAEARRIVRRVTFKVD